MERRYILPETKTTMFLLQAVPLIQVLSFQMFFLSLHYNSTPELPDVKGVGTYYYSDTDQSLAKYVHKGILHKLG